jgi:hypothetical protein
VEAEQFLESKRVHQLSACRLLITQQEWDAATGNISFLVKLASEGKKKIII